MSEDRAKAVGERFRKAREKLGLTQQDVADKIGLNVSHYAKIERGDIKTSFENHENISKVLKLKP